AGTEQVREGQGGPRPLERRHRARVFWRASQGRRPRAPGGIARPRRPGPRGGQRRPVAHRSGQVYLPVQVASFRIRSQNEIRKAVREETTKWTNVVWKVVVFRCLLSSLPSFL